MRLPYHSQFLWQNFEFRVRAIDGLQIYSLKPSELGTIFLRSLCLCVMPNSQKMLTRLNRQKI